MGAAAGNQRSRFEGGSEVGRGQVGDDPTAITGRLQAFSDELVESESVRASHLHHAVRGRADRDSSDL